jgi:rod shape-determining protein MreC
MVNKIIKNWTKNNLIVYWLNNNIKNWLKSFLHHEKKYKKVVKGDTIVTSDYNAVFPPNIPIGIVAKVGVQKDDTFHDIKVMLFTQFTTLQYVYVIKNRLAGQQAKLESTKPKAE